MTALGIAYIHSKDSVDSRCNPFYTLIGIVFYYVQSGCAHVAGGGRHATPK